MKKRDLKNRELVLASIALAGSLAAMTHAGVATAAGLTCVSGTTSSPMMCTGDTGGYISETFYFTGSNGVNMSVDDTVSGVALCGSHISGKNKFGLSTDGGSMITASGTGGTATYVTGGGSTCK